MVHKAAAIRVALFAIAAWFGFPGSSVAACAVVTVIGMSDVESAFHQVSDVFVARVESVPVVESADTGSPLRQHVRLQLLERFKGAMDLSQPLEFGLSGENFTFEKDQHVVVYALRGNGTWTTACTRTRLAGDADDEIRTLRALGKR